VLDAGVEERAVYEEERAAPRRTRLAVIIGVVLAITVVALWLLIR